MTYVLLILIYNLAGSILGFRFHQFNWIKSVSWEYSCDEEYLEEFDQEKFLTYSLLLAVLPRNRLDPVYVSVYIEDYFMVCSS